MSGQIYTDWANHYLDKVKSKRRIHDLPHDVTDGVVLADVIEAVSKFRNLLLLLVAVLVLVLEPFQFHPRCSGCSKQSATLYARFPLPFRHCTPFHTLSHTHTHTQTHMLNRPTRKCIQWHALKLEPWKRFLPSYNAPIIDRICI